MGLEIFLQDERGNRLASASDHRGVLARMTVAEEHTESCCLRFIDPYGHTMFNQLQMPTLLRELDWLGSTVSDPEDYSVIWATQTLALRCQGETDLYPLFVGD